MMIQSLYDQRAMFAKLINCFNNDGTSQRLTKALDDPNLCKMFTNCQLHNMLRTFHVDMQCFGHAPDLQTTGLTNIHQLKPPSRAKVD